MAKIDYRKMKPDPLKRMYYCGGVLGWNLIGRTKISDIENFVKYYMKIERDSYHALHSHDYKVVRLVDICSALRMTRARFLDILMSIMWSKIAFRKKYGCEPRVSNIVYSIDTSSHMLYQDKMNDEHLTMGYHFQIIKR